MEEKTEEKKAYEIGYLVRSEEAKGILLGHLKRAGALVLSEGEIRNIKLAYPILRLPSAHFGYIHFEIDPASIAPLANALKLDSEIMRFLIVTPPFTKEKSLPGSVPPASRARTAPKPEARPEENRAASNDLLEEKLEEILNK